MEITFQELEMYKNFNELADDVLDLAKEILPNQLFYLSSIRGNKQWIIKISENDTTIPVQDNMMINLDESVCQRIDFETKHPVIFEDTHEEQSLAHLKDKLEAAHVRSYLGIPISLVNGEKFGTLCAINDEVSHFDKKSIALLQRIVRMFSYYLNLEQYAYRDALTDLYNRRYLSRFYDEYASEGGTLFFLDLDGFKKVNDAHGHDAGDLVLKKVASKLDEFVKTHDEKSFAVRIGGDEFLVHVPYGAGESELAGQAEEILGSLSTWEEGYQLSTSIGIVSYPPDKSPHLETLLKQADEALYCAKTAGKNTYKFF